MRIGVDHLLRIGQMDGTHVVASPQIGTVNAAADWHLVGCKKAVQDYRERHAINDPIRVVDGNAYWVKQQDYKFPDSQPMP